MRWAVQFLPRWGSYSAPRPPSRYKGRKGRKGKEMVGNREGRKRKEEKDVKR